ncbi:uncharacterized protein PV07_01047 [Cladophialophora immunda]|uniref:UBL3-like ubiquitin domain-containing protein n=1 Tax=Cladophialophora immunda TaxID=569365 RepID=A0A0D2A1K2_9EURO|nr:uncharacterized protein PV07_01047 [Cladophialophora immunda]KIW34256.1 hypothetical protein PV07_01047 [Cladophialophora immunda]OQU99085.1 hypothetical protein CLAIMM_04772 [Cladophialophora immunda]
MSNPSSNPAASSDAQPTSSSPPETTSSPTPEPPLQSSLGPQRTDTNTAMVQAMDPPLPSAAVAEPQQKISRQFSTAIGPSSDEPTPTVPAKDEAPAATAAGPTLTVTLLLTSGARHPFKLDNKYFAKRNVEVPENDPFNLSVYKLKELILREWREEWETKPSSPTSIRLISMGKLLDDKASLKDYKFSVDAPNVLHMTIKPQDYVEEDDAKGGKSTYSAHRESEGRSPGCRCIIM